MNISAPDISWTGEFKDPQLERGYMASTERLSLGSARLCIIATTATSLAFAPLDILSFSSERLAFVLGDRALIALVCVAALLALTRFRQTHRVAAITYAQQYVFFTLNALIFNHPVLLRHGGALIPLIGMALFMILPGSFRAAGLLCAYACSISLMFWGVLRPDPESPLDLAMIGLMVVVAYVVGGIGRSQFGRMRREEYLHIGRERQINQRLLEAKEAAELGSRAKANFLAVMSHEIRTPMNGVLGMVRLVLDSPLAPLDRQRLATACQSAESLLTILDDILDISKLDAGNVEFECEPFALRQTFENVAALMDLRAREKGLFFTLEMDRSLPAWVSGDSARLRQVLFNLIGNAVKFTETGGVTVEVRNENLDSGLARLHVAITDTGIGISPEQQERLFQAFAQADASITRRFGGTGLGLVICKKLVEGMGGMLACESMPGRGSCFRFSLTFQPTQPILHPPVPVSPARPLSVLVAEDNPVNCEVAKAYLLKSGHTVTLAANGIEAVDMAARGGFDLILMDIHMPEMDGLEATRRIRTLPGAAGQVPVIALTANAMRSDVAKCRAAGMNAHLAKPMTQKGLDGTIAQVMARHRLTGDAPHDLCLDILLTGTIIGEYAAHLKQWGHRVFAVSPEAAQAMLSARPFDLVIVGSPDATTITRLHHAAGQQGHSRPPLLVLTDDPVTEPLRDAGADEILPATPTMDDLAGAIRAQQTAMGETENELERLLGPERIARMRDLLLRGLQDAAALLEQPDLPRAQLLDIAHRIKGSAANMRLSDLAQAADHAMRAAEAALDERIAVHDELREATKTAIVALMDHSPKAKG